MSLYNYFYGDVSSLWRGCDPILSHDLQDDDCYVGVEENEVSDNHPTPFAHDDFYSLIDDDTPYLPSPETNDSINETTLEPYESYAESSDSFSAAEEPSFQEPADSVNRKRTTRPISQPIPQNSFIDKKNRVAQLFSLTLSLAGYLPKDRPALFSEYEWLWLKSMSSTTSLVECLAGGIFTCRVLEKLELFYFAFAKYGYQVAVSSENSKKLVHQFKKSCKNANVFGPIKLTPLRDTESCMKLIGKSLSLTNVFSDNQDFRNLVPVEKLQIISTLVRLTLKIMLSPSEMNSIIVGGTQDRSIKLVNRFEHSLEASIYHVCPGLLASQPGIESSPRVPTLTHAQTIPLSEVRHIYSQQSVSNPDFDVSSLRVFDTFKSLHRIHTLFFAFTRSMPTTIPRGMDLIQYNKLLEEGFLNDNVRIISKNFVSVTYSTPIAYDAFCSNRFSNFIDCSDLEKKTKSNYDWWRMFTIVSPVSANMVNEFIHRTIAIHHLLLRNVQFQAMDNEQTRLTLVSLFRKSLLKSAGEDGINTSSAIAPIVKRSFAQCYDEAAKEIVAELEAQSAVGGL